MCVVKTPKIKAPEPGEKEKPLPVITNPILDGIDPSTNSLRVGRSSLRIRRDPSTGPTRMAPALPNLRIANGGP